jgi:phosphonate transport system substrate-binding protein
MRSAPWRTRATLSLVAALALTAAACGDDSSPSATQPAPSGDRTLRISAIPDQDPAKLVEINSAMATYLADALGVKVEYVPVSDYAASVSLFRAGDLDMVFFGGLTGVQARLQAPGSTLLAQRDVDDAFRSVFIAGAGSGVGPMAEVAGLAAFKGKRFTFGSESSTSGRLMPEFFLDQAGVTSERDFTGAPGYSGSHDKTVDLVEAGSFDGGALNAAVWDRRKAAGTVDQTKVVEVFRTPPYRDYHWIAGPRTDERFGAGFAEKAKAALLALDYANPEHTRLLDLYSAKKFIPTEAGHYREIESIGRKLRLIS